MSTLMGSKLLVENYLCMNMAQKDVDTIPSGIPLTPSSLFLHNSFFFFVLLVELIIEGCVMLSLLAMLTCMLVH